MPKFQSCVQRIMALGNVLPADVKVVKGLRQHPYVMWLAWKHFFGVVWSKSKRYIFLDDMITPNVK